MRYEDAKLLLSFSKLMLQVSAAKNPGAEVDITEETITKSAGYQKLRAFFVRLSPAKRDGMRRMMRNQVNGVRELLNKARATGEQIGLGDIEFDLRDAETGQQFPDRPNVQLEPDESTPGTPAETTKQGANDNE